ncbi:MFS transporter [Paenibacillus tianjinensis]|uniref:MFS transporter n=1 Tax=Paenibacillus tianjinensis TaxID=2810347 RepID=A0ABX7LK60_9BACL|nr:MFS transporter [Paenibacillus tianjinensis]
MYFRFAGGHLTVAGIGSAAGVLLGGVLTSSFGWPAVFYVNVPIGLIVIATIPFLVSKDTAGGTRKLGYAGCHYGYSRNRNPCCSALPDRARRLDITCNLRIGRFFIGISYCIHHYRKRCLALKKVPPCQRNYDIMTSLFVKSRTIL